MKDKFTAYFVHPPKEACESICFHQLVQEPGETVDNFYPALWALVRKCHYPSAEGGDHLVRGSFVVRFLDLKLSDKLCLCPTLTMAEARLQTRIHEDAVKARATVFRVVNGSLQL